MGLALLFPRGRLVMRSVPQLLADMQETSAEMTQMLPGVAAATEGMSVPGAGPKEMREMARQLRRAGVVCRRFATCAEELAQLIELVTPQ